MKVVVIGASGNVGSRLVDALLAHPDVTEVMGVARRPPERSDITWHTADVATSDLRPLLRGADVVVHLAWLLVPSRKPEMLARVNLGGTQAVLDAVAAEGIPALVYGSSIAAYAPGPKQPPVDETYPRTGISSSLYSRQKAAAERLLDVFEEQHPERRVVRIRPGIVLQAEAASSLARYFLGPLIPQRVIRPGLLGVVPRTPDLAFQAVHASDLAEAYVAAVTRPATGAFNVAGSPVLDAAALAQALQARQVPVPRAVLRTAVAAAWRLRLLPMDPGWVDLGTQGPLMDCGRARRELGWTPKVDVRDALAEVVAAMGDGEGADTPVLRPREAGLRRRVEALAVATGRDRR